MNIVYANPYWQAVRAAKAAADLERVLELAKQRPGGLRLVRRVVIFSLWLNGRPSGGPLELACAGLQAAWDCLRNKECAAYWAGEIRARLARGV